MTERLDKLRQEIDRLDDGILGLIDERMRHAGDIIAAKGDATAYRPGREAAVVARLLERRSGDAPADLLVSIWRQLMTTSLVLQNADIHVVADHGAARTAGWHLGGFVRISEHGKMERLIGEMEGGADFAFVSQAREAEMAEWLFGDRRYHVIAGTPLVPMTHLPHTWIVGREPADPAPDETTVLAWQGDGGRWRIEQLPGERLEEVPPHRAGKGRIAGVIASTIHSAGRTA